MIAGIKIKRVTCFGQHAEEDREYPAIPRSGSGSAAGPPAGKGAAARQAATVLPFLKWTAFSGDILQVVPGARSLYAVRIEFLA
jgi:hypothetical protein